MVIISLCLKLNVNNYLCKVRPTLCDIQNYPLPLVLALVPSQRWETNRVYFIGRMLSFGSLRTFFGPLCPRRAILITMCAFYK